jgi:hypothetical protein
MRPSFVPIAGLFALGALSWPSLAVADARVEGIKVMALDRQKNQIVPLSKIPNPFGVDADILISVYVKGPPGDGPSATAPKVVLELSSPAYSDEQSGDNPAWSTKLERQFRGVGETGASYYPFLLPYDCRRHVTITARVGSSSKSVKADFVCAE